MFFRFLFILCILPLSGFPQRPDVDDLTEELDLSLLDNPGKPPAEPADIPSNHLFVNFDLISVPVPAENQIQKADEPGLYRISLPAAEYLVAPNPARMDDAYARLAQAVSNMKLKIHFPVKVLLHADGNFSVALPLGNPPEKPLPQGLDLSPQPKTVFAAVQADIQLLRKDHPPLLEAFLRLSEAATREGWELDRREFFLFPQSPGKVWFALRVIQDSTDDRQPHQEQNPK